MTPQRSSCDQRFGPDFLVCFEIVALDVSTGQCITVEHCGLLKLVQCAVASDHWCDVAPAAVHIPPSSPLVHCTSSLLHR